MFNNKMTMLILSCGLFSDLWDAHVYQLEKYWADRGMDTYIVTDKRQDTSYENVKVIAAGDGVEFTDRLKYALEQIESEYIFPNEIAKRTSPTASSSATTGKRVSVTGPFALY